MQFTISSSCGGPSIEAQFFGMMLFLGPVLGIPLLLWLRRSPRNAQDVLGSALVPPASAFRRLLDFSGWLSLAMLLLVPPMGATALIHASMFFREDPLAFDRTWRLEPSWAWIAAAVLASSGYFIHWLRTSTSERDVLRVGTRA
ncbi:MAG TPA: hypothetical protein VLQ93_17690 [Myxococcaceae bacterium]|nr:hypothetical protein [Myxococcaceae bacterium]